MNWKRAVVVGGSGGIGAALAGLLESRGTRVYRLSRSADDPNLRIDIEDEGSINAAAELVAADGSVDLVIVATGILQGDGIAPEKSWRDLSADGLAKNFAVNASGPALVAKYFLPLLPREDRAVFAALSARVGSIGDNRLGGWYGYRASKAALNMLVKSLSVELSRNRSDAICVALHPGTVDTPLSAPFQGNVDPEKLFDPGYSAGKLLDVLARLGPGDSGKHFAWDGQVIEP